MVRKWSYINEFNPKNSKQASYYKSGPVYLNRVHVLKVFKSRTRFKKCYTGLETRFLRLKYRRRKHRTSWLTFSYILYFWVKNFLKYKQFIRFYQSVGLFSYQLYSTDTSFLVKALLKSSVNHVLNTFSCSRRIIQYFNGVGALSNTNLLESSIKNTKSTGLLLSGTTSLKSSESLNLGLLSYEGLLYPYNTNLRVIHLNNYISSYRRLNNANFNFITSYVVSLYRINCLLILKRM